MGLMTVSEDAMDRLLTLPGRVNPFEDFEQTYPVAPWRRIAITPEVLADEARKQRQREAAITNPAQAWREKVQLDVANLRTVRPKAVAPGRVADTRLVAAPREPRRRALNNQAVAKPARICANCPAPLGKITNSPLCRACRPARVKVSKRRKCPGCGKGMSNAALDGSVCYGCRAKANVCVDCGSPRSVTARSGRCRPCFRAAAEAGVVATPAHQPCSAGCGRTLRPSNTSELCFACKDRQRSRALPVPLVPCSAGCGRTLRRGRTEGLCGPCMDKTRDGKPKAAAYRARRSEREGKRCEVCGVLVKYSSKTLLCAKHVKLALSKRTVLRARTRAELELDRKWSLLSEADKEHVLAGALSWSGGGYDQPPRRPFDDGLRFRVEGTVG